MSLRFLSAAVITACLAFSQAAVTAETVVGLSFIEVGSQFGASNLNATETFSTASTDDLRLNTIVDPFGGGAAQSGIITLTDGAFTGDYNISVNIAAGTGTTIGRGGSGTISPVSTVPPVSAGGDLFQVGEQLTFSDVLLTKVSGDDFVFDGFTGAIFGNANADSGEAGTANGTTFTITDVSVPGINTSGRGLAPFGAIPLASTIVASGNQGTTGLTDGVSLNAVAAQFSAVGASVPEPSSLALLGLGSLTVLVRRRKS